MKLKFLLVIFVFFVGGFNSFCQETRLGQVITVIPFGNQCYSVINEVGTYEYYKTSPHNNLELTQGHVVQLLFDGIGNSPNSIQVIAPDVQQNLFCQIIESNDNINSLLPLLRDDPEITDFVSYNSDHDVLIFDTWKDVRSLELLLEDQEKKYELNQGNEKLIFNVMSLIRLNGWNMSSNSNGNKVSLVQFKDFLNQSRPLGGNVLIGLIELDEDEGLNPDFLRDVFMDNLPLTYTTEQRLLQSSFPTGIINQIIETNDNFLDAPNYVYDDFQEIFPQYNSLYKNLNTEEIEKLQSGMDPEDPLFDNDIVILPFERLIMNDKYEVWIEGHLYKLYEACKAIAMQNSVNQAYEDIAVLNNDGSPSIPQITEDNNGITQEVMNEYIPEGYMIYNPTEYDPLGNSNDDPFYNTALQTYNISSGCPISNFSFSLYSSSDLTVDFYGMTDWDQALDPESSYIQYWSFGDGTGSFLDNPVHIFPDYGAYTVRLTTFNADCGCWHVHTVTVNVLEPQYREGNPDCPISSFVPWTVGDDINTDLDVNLVVSSGSPVNSSSTVIEYIYEITETNGTSVVIHSSVDDSWTYTLSQAGDYIAYVTLVWSDGCVSPSDPDPFTVTEAPTPPDCCDKQNREKSPPYLKTYNDDEYKLKTNDLARGSFGTVSWRKIQGTQKLYVKKKNKILWKKQPAWHDIFVYGTYWYRVYIPGKGSVCDVIPFPYETYGRNCAGVGEKYSTASGAGTFYDKFGLDENSITIQHKVYLGGTMVTIPPSPGDCCNCYSSGGYLLFDEVVELGECDE